MLPKENRLKKKNDFDRVSKEGQQVRGDFFILKFCNNGLRVTRVGFVVSKKVSSKAVVRNKIKRHLREALRFELDKLRIGFDLVFFTKKDIEKAEFLVLEQAVRQLLGRARLYKQVSELYV